MKFPSLSSLFPSRPSVASGGLPPEPIRHKREGEESPPEFHDEDKIISKEIPEPRAETEEPVEQEQFETRVPEEEEVQEVPQQPEETEEPVEQEQFETRVPEEETTESESSSESEPGS